MHDYISKSGVGTMNIVIGFISLVSAIFGVVSFFIKSKNKIRKGIIALIVSLVLAVIAYYIGSLQEPPIPDSTIIPTEEPTLTLYVDPTFTQRTSVAFNYQIDIPSHFIYEGTDGEEHEEDFHYTSPDKRTDIVFMARVVGDELPNIFSMNYFKDLYGDTVTYEDNQLANDGWYAIEAKSSGMYHYRKCIFTNGIARMYTFSYPLDQEDIYLYGYNYVTRIENSFKQLH